MNVIFAQARSMNDNSYGMNAVGWPGGHKFGDLVGSDQAVFEFKDKNGNVVLNFDLDYISAAAGTPSGYASLGVSGGEGNMNVGSASHVLAWNTSLARSLNDTGYCASGVCTVSGVNLLLNSPPTVTTPATPCRPARPSASGTSPTGTR